MAPVRDRDRETDPLRRKASSIGMIDSKTGGYGNSAGGRSFGSDMVNNDRNDGKSTFKQLLPQTLFLSGFLKQTCFKSLDNEVLRPG